MGVHEEELLAVLEKVGQSAVTNEPSLLDSDTPDYVDTEETAGPSEPPLPPDETEMVGAPVDRPFAPVTRTNFWVHHDTHPAVLDIALLDKYQSDWFEWDAETMWREIKDDFRVPSIHDHVKTKIQAAKTLHITDSFWKQWEVFCWSNQSFNNKLPDFRVLQKPSVPQLMNTVDVSSLVRAGEEFTLEVKSFVAACMVEEGVFYAPNPLGFCQEEINRLLDENKVDHQDITKAVREKYREVGQLTEEAWLKSPLAVLGENVVDIQVAKLRVAWNYLSMRRRQMKDQLRLL